METAVLLLALYDGQAIFPRYGKHCPSPQYYESGSYCRAYSGSTERPAQVIPRSGDSCPVGWYVSGDYCKEMSTGAKR